MRIAQVAPLYERVPPLYYGGTERVVSYLTEALVELGHEVTLFASGDSLTAARLVTGAPRALRLDKDSVDYLAHHVVLLERVFKQAQDFDLIHFHIDYLHFPLSRRIKVPNITTLHGRLDLPDLVPLYQEFPEMPVVSISNKQREPLPWINWAGTVYHGLPTDLLEFHPQPGQYLAFLGRISPEKRVDRAIEIAKLAGIPIKIAAKIDETDREYFEQNIKHLLDHPLVEFIGEIGDEKKNAFLGNALALLFPIDWAEPFGLVMVEAMACGTPVIAFNQGSVPEIVEDRLTGFLCQNVEEAVAAVKRLPEISRRKCREVFEERFTNRRMARDYEQVYQQILNKNLVGSRQ